MLFAFDSFRPSTPVFDLLEHRFQYKWLDERQKAEEALRAKQAQKVIDNHNLHVMKCIPSSCTLMHKTIKVCTTLF